MALQGGALAGAWIGGLLAGVLVVALLLYLFRWFMQVFQNHFVSATPMKDRTLDQSYVK